MRPSLNSSDATNRGGRADDKMNNATKGNTWFLVTDSIKISLTMKRIIIWTLTNRANFRLQHPTLVRAHRTLLGMRHDEENRRVKNVYLEGKRVIEKKRLERQRWSKDMVFSHRRKHKSKRVGEEMFSQPFYSLLEAIGGQKVASI